MFGQRARIVAATTAVLLVTSTAAVAGEARDIDAVCPPPNASASGAAFTDTATNTHRDAIRCAADYGIVNGTSQTTYEPNRTLTRGQMATIVHNTLELALDTEIASETRFFDDTDGNVHADAINALASIGVVQGRSSSRFAPNEEVSRGAMARFFVNLVDYADDEDLNRSNPPEGDPERFDDVAGTTFEQDILRLAEARVVAGDGQGRYRPGVAVDRGQTATFVARAAAYLDELEAWSPTEGTEVESPGHDEDDEDVADDGFGFPFDPEDLSPDQLEALIAELLDLLGGDGSALDPEQLVELLDELGADQLPDPIADGIAELVNLLRDLAALLDSLDPTAPQDLLEQVEQLDPETIVGLLEGLLGGLLAPLPFP